MQLQPIETHQPRPVPEWPPHQSASVDAWNQANAVIAAIAEELKAQGSPYFKLYQAIDGDGQPWGPYRILADSDQPAELRPGYWFWLSEFGSATRLSVNVVWPEFRYTTPATHQPRQATEKFTGKVDSITISRDRKSTRLNSSHSAKSRMPSSA